MIVKLTLAVVAALIVLVIWRAPGWWRDVRSGWIILDNIDEGNIENVRELLDARPQLLNASDTDGNTPLHVAAGYGQKEMVALLLSHGANVNARRNNGATPLHIAAHHGNAEIIELLAAHGAEIDARAAKNLTPLHMAVVQGKREAVSRLLAHNAGTDLKDDYGRTPRDWAVGAGSPDIV